MELKSLAQVCQEFKLSRRIIQGYEKEGILKPTSRNNRGYLLYDEKAIQRMLFIRYCQNIGFKLKEIKEFINKPNKVIKTKIQKKLPELESSKNRIERLIVDSKKIIELLDQKNNEELIYKITKEENRDEKIN